MQRPEMRQGERNEGYNLPLRPTAGKRRREATPPKAPSPRKDAKTLGHQHTEYRCQGGLAKAMMSSGMMERRQKGEEEENK